ncbi:STAS domain-containing protein [Streptomyces sp. NPDC001928]|uniref:STAS domain-containing protein n=1 Tax=Streptomyces sp. NPDC001928 TaxID=3154404 RepID=UPI003324FFB5
MADPSVQTIAAGRCLVARVSGKMNFATAPVLRPQFKELIARGDRFIVLDLSGVPFCDSAGLNVLIGAWKQADPSGVALVLACVLEHLRRILRQRGLPPEATAPPQETPAEGRLARMVTRQSREEVRMRSLERRRPPRTHSRYSAAPSVRRPAPTQHC